jgi:hypothetical protein
MCGETTSASLERSKLKTTDGSAGFYKLRLPDEHIASIFLLLPLFDKQLENSLSVRFVAHAIEKTPIALDISASEELIHVGLGS